MDTIVDTQVKGYKSDARPGINMSGTAEQREKTNRRGRPKGARTTSLAEVRKQAAEERKQMKTELGNIIAGLQDELTTLKQQYEQETGRLQDELELMKRREGNYQQALGERLHEVAAHLETTLLKWGTAELEEAQVDKRGRGRPRKTLK